MLSTLSGVLALQAGTSEGAQTTVPLPTPLLSPVFSKIGREFHGRNAAAGMRLFLIVANAFLNLLGVLNLNVNEATSLTMT